MSGGVTERVDLAIEAYHDGTLDDVGAALLVNALRSEQATQVRERLAMGGLLGQVFTADDAVVRSVCERIDGERTATAVVRAVRGSLASTTRRQRRRMSVAWLPRVAVAVLLLLTIGGGWWLSAREQPLPRECRLEASAPQVVIRHGREVTVRSGEHLAAGDQLRANATTTLVWADGSQLILDAGSRLDLSRPTLGPGCRLDQGRLTAEIAPQRMGLPFSIATSETRIDVLGTRFNVQAQAQRTEVELHEGAVRLTRQRDARVLMLRPGDAVVVAADQEFVIRTAPGPSPEPAWKPLFSAQGLMGWVQQHGRWSNDQGIIRGAGAQGGKARLIGNHPYGDLELRGRLRITGVAYAELQVGDYNWFVEVPAKGAEWVAVEVRQRGSDLTITADGTKLPLQAGAGVAMRTGPLAFYVMPGGTLEISDAQIRIPAK